jgi:polyisoprenoid-binding protein YceI
MRAQPEQMTAPTLQALLADGALAGGWALDPGVSTVRLRNRSMGLVPVKGVFREVTGYGIVSPDGQVGGIVVVSAASIDTGNSRRDTHLRSADFFDSDSYPEITFLVGAIRPAGLGAAVTGSLTVRDCTLPLSFDAAATVRGGHEIRIDAEVHVNQRDFGLTWNRLGAVGANNTLSVHAVFGRR